MGWVAYEGRDGALAKCAGGVQGHTDQTRNKQTLWKGWRSAPLFPSWHCKDHPFSVALRS